MTFQSIEAFNKNAQKYDQWFDRHLSEFHCELTALRKVMPMEGDALEVGVGSGRFAAALGVKFGLDPSTALLKIAKSRGIETYDGVAESLPFSDHKFDTVLFITTLCFVDDPLKALSEAKRVLKENGKLIIGMIDKDSSLGKFYETNKKQNVFYQHAHFFSVPEVIALLKKIGFAQFDFYQTLSSPIEEINTVEKVESGYGKGAFIVIRAINKGENA